jgi:hypothetical protein
MVCSFEPVFELLRETTLSSSHSIPNNTTFSVALHSRHSTEQDNGCDITKEQAFFEQILDSAAQQTLDCHVFVMADRMCTIQLVSEFLRNTTCRVETQRITMKDRVGGPNMVRLQESVTFKIGF